MPALLKIQRKFFKIQRKNEVARFSSFFLNNFLKEFQMKDCIPETQTLQSTPILAYIWLSYGTCHMLQFCHIWQKWPKNDQKWHIWHKWRIWHVPYDSHIYAYMGVKLSVWVSGMQLPKFPVIGVNQSLNVLHMIKFQTYANVKFAAILEYSSCNIAYVIFSILSWKPEFELV